MHPALRETLAALGALLWASSALAEPAFVLTYEGELTEFPREARDGQLSISLPEANHPRLIRGGDAACASEAGMARWSFPIAPGTKAQTHVEPGRIEITFAAAAQTVLPSQTTLAIGLDPIAEESPQTGSSSRFPGDALAQPIALAALDLAVPESPAFAALGVSPETVTRPTSPRDFATSLLSAVDKNGNFQSGVALDTAPFLLFSGNRVTLREYQTDYVTRLLSRTEFSFATSKGASTDDKATRLSLGLHLTFFDNGDPRLDQQLLSDFSSALHSAGGTAPIGFGPEAEPQIAEVNARFGEGVAAAQARREAERRNWNASSWSAGIAPSWIDERGDAGDFQWNGIVAWSSLAYGFENIEALRDRAQLIVHLRYRSHEQIPERDSGDRDFLTQDSLLAGARFRFGAPDFNCSLDAACVRESRAGTDRDLAGRLAFSIERKVARNLWFSVSLGKEFDHQDGRNPLVVSGGFKFGYSQPPTPESDRERTVATSPVREAKTVRPVEGIPAPRPAASPRLEKIVPIHAPADTELLAPSPRPRVGPPKTAPAAAAPGVEMLPGPTP